MKGKTVWLALSCLTVLVLVATACAPAAKEEAPAAPTAPIAPAVPAAPAAPKEAAPAVKEAAPAEKKAEWKAGGEMVPAIKEVFAPGRETIKVTLTKLDGTPVNLLVEKPQYGGVITIRGPASPAAWDETMTSPYAMAGQGMDWVQEMLLVGDWTKGPAGTNEVGWTIRGWFNLNYQRGMLAESWEFPDDETIIFHLRKGIRWQNRAPVNGRELEASDVVYSLRRIYFDTPTSEMYGMAGAGRPTNVYAKDKYTVVVKTPPGFLITTLDYVAGWTRIVAPEVEKQYGSQNVKEKGVGTGPFIITDYVPDSSITYVRNPSYWDTDHMLGKDYPLPYLDGVRLLVIPDESTRDAALRLGKLDAQGLGSSTVVWEAAQTLIKTAPRLNYNGYSVNGRYWIVAGRLDRDLPTQDIRVRRALQMAINHQEIVDTLYGGKADILSRPVPHIKEWEKAYTPVEKLPPSSDGFDNKKLYGYYPYEQTLKEAKQLLTEAGYPNGFKTTMIISPGYTYGMCMPDLAQALIEYWAKIGVKLILDVRTAAVRTSIMNKKTHDEGYFHNMASGFPQHMYPERAGNQWNMAMVNDPKMEELYQRISVLTPFTDPKWWGVLSEYNLYSIDRAYYVSMPAGYEWAFWQPWLRRYYGEHDIGPYKYSHQWLIHSWLDQKLKTSLGY